LNDTGACEAKKAQQDYKKAFKFSDDDVEMHSYQIPENYNLDDLVEKTTKGDGWFKLEGMFSQKDVEMAREIIYYHNKADKELDSQKATHVNKDELHNKYNGLVWALFNKGRIFQKFAQHPVILNISAVVLGESATISSYAANTVLPGQGGQLPHLDYPYYRQFYPANNQNIMDSAPPLSFQFVTLLTDFNLDNGGTAIRPNSHHNPRYPDDKEDFYRNAIQMEGKAGDVVVFHGALQHCAMPNHSDGLRTGILQHMAPVYIKPFEAMADYVAPEVKELATPAMRRMLALDHPYPILKQ